MEFPINKEDGMTTRRDIIGHCSSNFATPMTFSNEIKQLVLVFYTDFLETFQVNTIITLFKFEINMGVCNVIE